MNITGGSTPLLTASGNLIGTAAPVGGLPTAPAVIGQPASAVVSLPTGSVTSAASTAPNAVVTSVAIASSTTSHVSPKRSRNPPDPNRKVLFEDDRLPPGWHRKVSQRKSGASAGRYEVFIIGPTGKRFRSRNELKAFFEKTHEPILQPEHFDFSTFGTNAVNLPKEYCRNKTPTIGLPTPRDLGPPKLPTQPLAQASAAALASTSLGLSGPPPPVFKSQLSQETAEADAQISQLLESLQKDSANKLGNLPVDSDKMSELFNSFTSGDDNSCSSPPPAIVKPGLPTSGQTMSSTISPEKLTSGATGFQASFLNSIAKIDNKNSRISPSMTETAAVMSSTPPVTMNSSMAGVTGSIPVSGMTTLAGVPSVGGISTQRRALQNLPQNTKLVRGPNGQYSLQKVQTIELTIEQQNVSLIYIEFTNLLIR